MSGAVRRVNQLGFYAKGGEVKTDILWCRDCGLFWREFPEPGFALEKHFELSSYTQLGAQERWRRTRGPFFSELVGLVAGFCRTERPALLDYGCSYGHLMDEAAGRGFACSGVELVAALRHRLQERYPVYKALREVGPAEFDAITAIDSLYYAPDPVAEARRMRQLLKPQAVLVVRIANRGPLLRWMLRWRGSFGNQHMGDQLLVFNDRAMRVLAKRAGLSVVQVVVRERKPLWDSWRHLLGYGLLPLLCRLTGLKWTPGLTYVLQKVGGREA